ncbi:selenide, water dikinase [Caldalkalibacillus thermarum]|nr:selenide, water dikinase [Caldalkalibacillus thermarum]
MLRHLPETIPDPNLLVGLDTSDDAGVYRLTDELALVQTVDFFTPIVDDPYMFGQIAAANSLSDIYAMGAKPLTVLNIVGFPVKKLDKSILADILRGAADKVAEAGATLVGGHSIDDAEPKFGLACTGIVHPDKVLKNAGAKPGDRLLLTKPIGVGIQTTAIKRDLLSAEELQQVMQVMAALNKTAAEVMADFEVHACTDITGFGLLGHAAEMAKGSQVGLVIQHSKVPVLPGTRRLAEKGIVPGGTKANHRWLSDCVSYAEGIDELEQWILCDAVTSGGLLMAAAEQDAAGLLAALHQQGVDAAEIGYVTSDHPGCIKVTD